MGGDEVLGAAADARDPLLGALLATNLPAAPPPAESDALSLLHAITARPIPRSVLEGHEEAVLGAQFSPDGRRLVTASWDGTARVWPIDGRGQAVVLRGHSGGVIQAAFSPDGQRVATASADGSSSTSMSMAEYQPAEVSEEPPRAMLT